MSSDKKLMEQFLKRTPEARFRKHLYRVIGRIMQKEHVRFGMIEIGMLEDYVKQILNLDRNFRLVMNENDWWSEEDKDNKKVLEQKKQKSLGYEAGFSADVKAFDKIN